MGMERESGRPNVVATATGVIVAAVIGTLIGFGTEEWWLALGVAVAITVIWVVAQRWAARRSIE
ncbi:MAG: hypothetical protein GX131_13365 [candidate division WS1 bacterium]|jgi:low affinity Fe/Cu permease|nr:hypothetical protein [candidate division WS1 bacterium]